MYLSRVEIDRRNRRKIRELTHLGAYHSWVEDSFVDDNGKYDDSRKLWRVDTLKDKEYLLILSVDKPNLKKLEKYGVPGTAKYRSYNKFLDSLKLGTNYDFKVTLNPVTSISSGKNSGKRGRVVPHVTVEQQIAFLEKQASKNGFELIKDSYSIVQRDLIPLGHKKQNRPVRLSVVTYQGKLVINDLERFTSALIDGIGRKKAYGCGLLTVIEDSHE